VWARTQWGRKQEAGGVGVAVDLSGFGNQEAGGWGWLAGGTMTRGTHVGRAGALYPPAHCTRTSLAPPPPYTHPQANADWSLFCPNEAPGLADCWGEEFEALYSKYEREGRPRKVIKAQQLWFAIMEAQVGPCGRLWALLHVG
jgi:hypothetical protein